MDLNELRSLMNSGQMYDDLSDELVEAHARAVAWTDVYSASAAEPPAVREAMLRSFLAHVGDRAFFEPTFRCEFAFNISIGDDFFANFDCVMLDGAQITIGDHVLFGPRVGIYTSNHALDASERRAGGCYAKPVTIGDDVWVGGGVTINQGVTIGDRAIIGSGSVVTYSIPADTTAVGVPARTLRRISEADRTR